MYISRKELADALKVELRTVTNWINAADPIPSHKKGRERVFVLGEVMTWYAAKCVREAPAQPPPDFDEAKTRKMSAEAELAEHALAQARKEFISVKDLAAKLGPVFDTIRAKLLAIPGRLAPRVVACRDLAEARQMLEEEISLVLTELSEWR